MATDSEQQLPQHRSGRSAPSRQLAEQLRGRRVANGVQKTVLTDTAPKLHDAVTVPADFDPATTLPSNAGMPGIIEPTAGGERAFDLVSWLFNNRIILLNGPIDEATAESIVLQILALDFRDAKKPIEMYINSPGGSVTDGLAIYDAMQIARAPIKTVCTGMAASMGAVLLSAGDSRVILPNARVMVHQVSSGTQGLITDQKISLAIAEEMNERLMGIIAWNTGHTVEEVKRAADRDFWMLPEAALAWGIVDEIQQIEPSPVKRPKVPTTPDAINRGVKAKQNTVGFGAKGNQNPGRSIS